MSLHRLPEVIGTALGFSALAGDAFATNLSIIPTPESTPTTGDPWADVAIFALRVVCVLGVSLGSTVVGKWIDKKRSKKKGKRNDPPVA